jgi:hypothetical protein
VKADWSQEWKKIGGKTENKTKNNILLGTVIFTYEYVRTET